MQLGEAIQQIIDELGDDVDKARIVMPETGDAYQLYEATETMPCNREVFAPKRHNYGDTSTWIVYPISQTWKDGMLLVVAIGITPVPSVPEIEFTSSWHAIAGDHEIDALDMEWTCECGNLMEVDAPECGECGAANPFYDLV